MTALVWLITGYLPFASVDPALNYACATSKPAIASYQVRVCFTNPLNAATMRGVIPVSTNISLTGTDPGIRRAVYYLDGTYLLTDYQAPYTFRLPTTRWADGAHTLEVRVLLRDGFSTGKTTQKVYFKNAITTPEVNQKTFTPKTGKLAAANKPFVVMATGDGAGGEASANKVVNLIAAENPNLLLYLGDVYEKGTSTEFYNWYGVQGTNFSRFRDITDPTIGNHEYSASPTGEGYFDYWDNIPDYYSFNAGGWHFVSLNSNARRTPNHSGSDQHTWLQQDLEQNAGACTIVFYHHPYLNIGSEGPRPALADVWQLMAQYKVSIVLNGHDHTYQRWTALDASGNPDSNGITQFVAGGGGHGVQSIVHTDSRVAYSNANNPDVLGALKLTLSSSQARFEYKSIIGVTLDSGTVTCKK